MDKAQEPDLRDQLLADYDRHEDAIDKASTTELWALGDWLVQYVPNTGNGRPPKTAARPVVSLQELSERRGRGISWLRDLRAIAHATAPDRLPLISPRAYQEALRQSEWDLVRANASLVKKGHRLRDQMPAGAKMESVGAIKESIAKRTPDEQAEIAREVLREPTVRELLGGEPVPDFGANWADLHIVRISEQTDKLASLVKREGLVFSPDAELMPFLEMLDSAERAIADVRAAVQERIRDARLQEGVH